MTSLHTVHATPPQRALLRSADDLRRAMRQVPADALRDEAVGLDRVLRWDAPRALIEVQSGTRWGALAARLAEAAPGIEACLAECAIAGTVGDAAASNAPGPDGQPLVELIEAVTLVTADCELRTASRARDAELFALAVGGHGIFGAVYSVTLRLDALALAARRARPRATRLLRQGCGGATRAPLLLVPPARQEDFLTEAHALAETWRAPIERIELTTTLPEQETALRWAKHAYAALSLHLALPQPLGARVRGRQLCSALIDCAIAHGGSFAIGTTRDASPAQLEHCYPELARVLLEQRRRDPQGRLQNAWYRHHRRLLDGAQLAVRWNAPQAASA